MKKYIPVLSLIVLSLFVIVINFNSKAWLTGWDDLHPEFDLSLNIKRSLFSVWQEYQGVGLLGGMGHAADLPRQIFLAILSVIFPTHTLRFITTSLMLILGPLGVYYLLDALLPRNITLQKREMLRFSGGIFYLFNLATVQIFYLPFEAFVFHYGFLPWLLYGACSYFKTGRRKSLLLFTFLSIVSTTQSYVPTLFIVYGVSLASVSLGAYFQRRKRDTLKKALMLFIITISVNAFWLFPFTYFTITSSHVVGNAYENYMATEDVYLRNKEFGRISDVSLLKGFWFNFVDINKDRIFTYMIGSWRQHLSDGRIASLGYLFFIIILLGFFNRLKKRKEEFSYAVLFLFLIPFTFLANDTPPFAWIDTFLNNAIPLFAEVFRVPFTKFAIFAALSYSVLFAFGMSVILSYTQRLWRYMHFVILALVCIALTIFVFPVFEGQLFYSLNQLQIPKEYLLLMDFFRSQDKNERIANFPQHTYWGWNHYTWGYRGSGFLWYGIEQPILDRAFDGYSFYNENYYWELSQAIYSGNITQFQKILQKYQITWLVVDRYTLSLESPKALYLNQFIDMLQHSPEITPAKNFGNLQVYKVALQPQPKNFIFFTQNIPIVAPTSQWNNLDQAYLENGTYIASTEPTTASSDVYYPFRSLFTGRKQDELAFKVFDKGDYFSLQTTIPKNLAGAKLIIPEIEPDEVTQIDTQDLEKQTKKLLQIFIDGELVLFQDPSVILLSYIHKGNIEVRIPKITGYYSYNSKSTNDLFSQPKRTCNPFNQGIYSREVIKQNEENFLRFISVGSSNCIDIDLTHLSQNVGYVVSIQSKYSQGKNLLFSIINKTTERSDVETYLPKQNDITTSYFIIPPMEHFGLGYSLHFDNISIGREKTVNDLGQVTVNQIPYRFLTSLKIVKGQQNSQSNPILLNQSTSIEHPNPSYYSLQLDKDANRQLNNAWLILSQGFDPGWQAYILKNNSFITASFPFLFGKNLQNHVLVNNWENGWKIDPTAMKQFNNATIILVFWPQYLEYAGFLFGISAAVGLLFVSKFRRSKTF